MKSSTFATLYNNSSTLAYSIDVGDADEITYCKVYFKDYKEEVILTREELDKLDNLEKNWMNLSPEEFKSLLFLVRI